MIARRACLAPAVAFALLSVVPRGAAAEGPTDDERYAFLDDALGQASRHERTYWTAWTATYATLTVGQGTFAWAIRDDGLRADATVGTVKSALGLLAVLLAPRTPLGAPSTLRSLDASTPDARRLRRLRAEELLHKSAQEELLATSWLPHVAAAVTNLAGAYVLFHEERRFVPGWLSLASGTVVAEIQILTQPTDALSSWNQYAGHGPSGGGEPDRSPTRPSANGQSTRLIRTAFVAPTLGGVVVGGSF